MPKWESTDRHNYLVSLWLKYGNKCLLGHNACPIPEHYIDTYSKLVYVPYAKLKDCIDRNGQPRFDEHGQRVQILEHLERKGIEHHARFIRLYDLKVEQAIHNFVDDDRQRERIERELESKLIHETNWRSMPLRGRFSGISRDIYHDNQPLYYLETIGISGIDFKPFAKIRMASSGIRLYVDISGIIGKISKNKRRKARRYGKPIAQINDSIDLRCRLAVNSYLNS